MSTGDIIFTALIAYYMSRSVRDAIKAKTKPEEDRWIAYQLAKFEYILFLAIFLFFTIK
jgi:hypothetical protein